MISSDWQSQIFEKRNCRLEFGSNEPKSGPKWGFLSFWWVWIISFPWNCIQCLTSSRGKTCEKNGGPECGPNGLKLGQKLGFSSFSQVGFTSFGLNCKGW